MLGLSEPDFWHTTPRYFAALQRAFIKRERREWERVRMIGFFSVLPHHDSKKRGRLTPQRLFPLPWDDDVQGRAIARKAPESFVRAADEIAKRFMEKNPMLTHGNNKST